MDFYLQDYRYHYQETIKRRYYHNTDTRKNIRNAEYLAFITNLDVRGYHVTYQTFCA